MCITDRVSPTMAVPACSIQATQVQGDTMGVLNVDTCRFMCKDVATSVKSAAAWAPDRSVYAAFGKPKGEQGPPSCRVIFFSSAGKVGEDA